MSTPEEAISKSFVLPAGIVHGICHYHGQWIIADERGFRSRNHRIHSTGDYKNPPPAEEHAGLRQHVLASMAKPPVKLHRDQYTVVGTAFVYKLFKMKCEVLIVLCGATHLHAMFVPTEVDVKKQIGKAKQFASLKCPIHQGQLWGDGCDSKPVDNIDYARELFGYIRDHEFEEDAWVWRFDKHPRPERPL